MKINPSVGLGQYKAYMNKVNDSKAKDSEVGIGKTQDFADEAMQVAKNTDKVEFSNTATAKAESGRFAKTLAATIEEGINPAKLNELKLQVQNGTYDVPTQEIVKSMLEMRV